MKYSILISNKVCLTISVGTLLTKQMKGYNMKQTPTNTVLDKSPDYIKKIDGTYSPVNLNLNIKISKELFEHRFGIEMDESEWLKLTRHLSVKEGYHKTVFQLLDTNTNTNFLNYSILPQQSIREQLGKYVEGYLSDLRRG